jgi:hypothetical protein
MIDRKLATLAAATVIGAALTAAPAEARFGGGLHGGSVRGPVFAGRPAFGNRQFSAGRRFAFIPHHRLVGPLSGLAVPSYGWAWPDYGYGDVPTDAFGDVDTVTPETLGSVPEPKRASGCNRSVETVTVPSEDGGTRQIKMIRCP